MPSNIAHMLIAYKALHRVQVNGDVGLDEMVRLFLSKTYKPFVNLGSVSPDLFYYASLGGNIYDIITDGAVKAKGVEPWAYHLHAVRPNKYPLNLVEITFKDTPRARDKARPSIDVSTEPENADPVIARLAFIAGHLSHMAADQIIHPLVNEIAGPYYTSGDNRKKHRTCEVYQDIFLYNHVYRLEGKRGSREYDFFEQKFNKWADIKTDGWTQNTEDWFRFFIQRGFAETYDHFPEEKIIEDSVDNLLNVLRFMTRMGPYKDAEKEYNEYVESGKKSDHFIEYFEAPRYLEAYREAVELSAVYMLALYEVYVQLKNGGDFSGRHKDRFLSIVRSADLSCPLERDILNHALAAYQQGTPLGFASGARAVAEGFNAVTKAQLKGYDENQLVSFSSS